MTPQNLAALQAYLRSILSARGLTIRAQPKKKMLADVLVADQVVGRVEVDDEDDELTYQVEIHVPTKPDPKAPGEMKRVEAELHKVLGGNAVVVKPRLSPRTQRPMLDSFEVVAGQDSLGTLSAEKVDYVFQFPVFDMDLEAFGNE
jgi:hypothetical protein